MLETYSYCRAPSSRRPLTTRVRLAQRAHLRPAEPLAHAGLVKRVRARQRAHAVAGLDVAENTVEEMAIFHVFGLAGNECLFRAFLWMAEHEGRWGAVDGWLDRFRQGG